jgi:hypothetical protein
LPHSAPAPPPADVIVEKIEFDPAEAPQLISALLPPPPPPTVIGKAVAVTDIFPAPSKGLAV